MLHTVYNPDGTVTIVDVSDGDDLFVPADGSATGTIGPAGTLGTTGNAPPAAETVTRAGSGLVFNNTYGSGVTGTFRNEIVAAENYLQSQFTNSCTINCNFDLQSLGQGISGENSFNPITVSYATYVAALASHATSAAQKAAVASLQQLADPSHGAGFLIPVGEARILGLAGGPTAGSVDDSVVLNTYYWSSTALQNNPTDAEGVLEHEITEGGMGRIGSLGIAATGWWAPMDLFRFTASGQRDFTGGRDGQATYFSVDGTSVNTGLQYHSAVSTSGQFDGQDFADWDQVGQDSNAHDPFGPGGPGAGDPGTLSATDLQIMNVLGWGQVTDGVAVSGTKQDALQGGVAVALLAAAPVITDSKSSTIASATVRIANGSGIAVSGDKLFVAGVQSGTVATGVSANWSAATSTLTLSGAASVATYQTLLGQVTYQDTGTDASSGAHPVRTVTWSVNDGTQTLPTTTSQVTVDRAPVAVNDTGLDVIGTTLSVAAGSGVLANDSDLDGDALSVTAVNGAAGNVGASVAGTYGHLTLNQNGGYSYVANGGVAAGSVDTFSYTVADGNGGSTSATLQVTLTSPAVVTSKNQSVAPGVQVALSGLFNITGSGITQYKVWFGYPEGGAPALGTLTNGGTSIALDQTVTLSSLNGWVYTGPTAAGTDKIWLQAYNGAWSNSGNWVETDITDSGSVVTTPVVTSKNQSVASGVQVALSSLFNIAGSGITQYKVWFSYPEGGAPAIGTLTNGSTSIALDQTVTLSSLNGWIYTGSAAAGTDKIWLQAYNGTWSNSGSWVETDITDPGGGVPPPPGGTAPVVTSKNQSVAPGVQVALSSLFNITGSGITQYKVWFSYPEGGAPALGRLTNGSTSIALDQTVTLSSLNGWVYTGGAATGTDKIWLQAYNGSWSNSGNWVETDITDSGSVAASPAVTSNNQSAARGAQVALSSLFNVTGSGITQYKVWFSDPNGGAPALGTLTNGGTSIALAQTVTLSSLNGWIYTGAATSGTDKIWLQAYNGSWSNSGNWVETDITDSGASSQAFGSSQGDLGTSLASGAGSLVFGNATGAGVDPVVIGNGSSVELVFSAAPVSFIGAGSLQLDHFSGFTGQISGFAAQDQIDLRDLVFNPQSTVAYAANADKTGGTLTVSNGSQNAHLDLLGDYSDWQFAASSDSHSGTIVTGQPAVATHLRT
jgi:hypothetical protein